MNLNNIDAAMHALDVRQQEGGGIEQPVTPMMREQVLNQRLAHAIASKRAQNPHRSFGDGDEVFSDDGEDAEWSQTSVRRELQFLLSHTIHHYALIVAIAVRHGIVDFPEGFGVAPSTLNYKLVQGV